jgi:hypothetical protein
MRNKMVAIIILLLAFSLLTLGIMQSQFGLISTFYEKMATIP